MIKLGSTLLYVSCAIAIAIPSFEARAETMDGISPQMMMLIKQCAPSVHPETMGAVISAESRGHMFAIADAGPLYLPWSKRKSMVQSFYFSTVNEASGKARALIAAGHTVSLGPAQINDRQLRRVGLTIEQAFDPCSNLRGGAQILTECYQSAVKKYGEGERALRAALSCYNSGDFERGERDGYVERVKKQVGRPLALRTGSDRVPSIQMMKAGPWWKNVAARDKHDHGGFVMSARQFNIAE